MKFDLDTWTKSIGLASAIAALLGGGFAALWAYAKLIIERGLLPPTELDVDCRVVGERGKKRVLEILLLIENKGSSPLIVLDPRLNVRYAVDEDIALEEDPFKSTFASAKFPRSLMRNDLAFEGEILIAQRRRGHDLNRRPARIGRNETIVLDKQGNVIPRTEKHEANNAKAASGIPIVRHATFVQSQIKQRYALITAVPRSTTQVLVIGSFRYGMRPTKLQRAIFCLARFFGIVQFGLSNVTERHTAVRAFDLSGKTASPDLLAG